MIRLLVRCLLGIAAICLAGCVNQPTFQSPLVSPLQLPSTVATPTAPLTEITPTEAPRPTATFTVAPAPSLTPTPTATYPPYRDNPFTLVFIREGNLWVSEIGGTGERQLTHEISDWPVVEYAIAPSCDRIAYIPYKGPPNANALIKAVRLPNDSPTVLAGENDPYIEYGVGWLDSDHLTLVVSEFAAPGYAKDPAIWEEIQPFHHIVLDLVTGKRTFIPESLHFSQSPNGRYWLTGSCGYVYECPLEYVLHDRSTAEQWRVAEDIGWGNFLGWSPDSQWMLFSAFERGETASAVRLILVDTTTRKAQPMTPADKHVSSASWSPNGQSIAFVQCDDGGCAPWILNSRSREVQKVSIEITDAAEDINWTPDSSRLIFTRKDDSSIIWSVKIDGTDLRPIASNTYSPQVLCKP
jgi:hypothetical protein